MILSIKILKYLPSQHMPLLVSFGEEQNTFENRSDAIQFVSFPSGNSPIYKIRFPLYSYSTNVTVGDNVKDNSGLISQLLTMLVNHCTLAHYQGQLHSTLHCERE